MGPNIPEKVKGFGKLGRFVRAILDYAVSAHIESILIENLPVGSKALPSATLKPTKSGTLVQMKLSAGGGTNLSYAFQILNASNADDGAQVRVRLGYLSDFVTSYIPVDMNVDDDPTFIMPVSNGDKIWIQVDFDPDPGSPTYGQISECSIDHGASVPANDFAGGTIYIWLGTVTVASGAVTVINQLAGGSFGFSVCGTSALYWTLG